MFSLCIPTMDRFDNYLKQYIPKYISNPLITEIIICDENGNDAKKIREYFQNNEKVKIFINEKRLGPFLNKIKCCKLAKNEWIALIDSDNFADEDYFFKMKLFIDDNKLKNYTILSPDYASEVFQWKYLSQTNNNLLNKITYKKIKNIDALHGINNKNAGCLSHLMNIGNFVINKSIINNINILPFEELISKSFSFDVCLFLLICFFQLDIDFYIVNNCSYIHSSSNDSIYLQYNNIYTSLQRYTYDKLWNILENN